MWCVRGQDYRVTSQLNLINLGTYHCTHVPKLSGTDTITHTHTHTHTHVYTNTHIKHTCANTVNIHTTWYPCNNRLQL